MELTYEVQLLKRPSIRVLAHYNQGSPLQLNYPHVAIKANRMHAFFPRGTWDVVSVAHEGVHIAHWAVHRRLEGDPERLKAFVPMNDVAWTRGPARVAEEAIARVSDRWLRKFFFEAEAAGLPFELGRPVPFRV